MNKILIILIIVVIVLIALLVWGGIWSGKKTDPKLETFAQCLAEKNVTMYGAVWCSWCKKQKADFGESFKYINYVECPDNPQRCLAAGVQGYPAWIFQDSSTSSPQAVKKLEGYQTLEQLSQASGCALQ
jgi:hypothetical protein